MLALPHNSLKHGCESHEQPAAVPSSYLLAQILPSWTTLGNHDCIFDSLPSASQPITYSFDSVLTARDFEDKEENSDFSMSESASPSKEIPHPEFPSLNNPPSGFFYDHSRPASTSYFEGENHGITDHSIDLLGDNLSVPLISSSIKQPPIAIEPTYVLAYGPFEAMDRNLPNDPSLWPIDYCVYLFPSAQIEPRNQFIYGGSRFHPAQIEEYIKVLPPPPYITQLDMTAIQFLEDLIQLIHQGVPPHMKIRILWNIMAGLTYIHTSPYGYAVHRSPHVEALMQIAAIYAYNPTSPYAELVHSLHPSIGSFEHNHINRTNCSYCNNHGNTYHDEAPDFMDDSITNNESESEARSEEDHMERGLHSASQISLIECPHSAPPQLPSPPCSPYQEAECDGEYIIIPKTEENPSDDRADNEYEPGELPTNGKLLAPVPFRPLILATTLGPFRQPSPPQLDSIPLPPISLPQQGLVFPQSLIQ